MAQGWLSPLHAQSWHQYKMSAKEKAEQGNYEEAAVIWKKALASLKTPSDPRYLMSLKELAAVYTAKGDLEKARNVHSIALKNGEVENDFNAYVKPEENGTPKSSSESMWPASKPTGHTSDTVIPTIKFSSGGRSRKIARGFAGGQEITRMSNKHLWDSIERRLREYVIRDLQFEKMVKTSPVTHKRELEGHSYSTEKMVEIGPNSYEVLAKVECVPEDRSLMSFDEYYEFTVEQRGQIIAVTQTTFLGRQLP